MRSSSLQLSWIFSSPSSAPSQTDPIWFDRNLCTSISKRHTHLLLRGNLFRAVAGLTGAGAPEEWENVQTIFILALFGRLKITIVFIKSLPSLPLSTIIHVVVVFHHPLRTVPQSQRARWWGGEADAVDLPRHHYIFLFAHYWFSLFSWTASKLHIAHWPVLLSHSFGSPNSRKESQGGGISKGKAKTGNGKVSMFEISLSLLRIIVHVSFLLSAWPQDHLTAMQGSKWVTELQKEEGPK